MRIQMWACAAICGALLAGPAAAAADNYVPTGPIVADSGFRPPSNAFTFPNYGKEQPYSAGIGVHEMRALFGDGVCNAQQPPSDSCALTPPALQWETNQNNSMGGGHCYGMSVTALRLFTKNLDPSSYLLAPPAAGSPSPTASSLLISDPSSNTINWPLAHMIALNFAMQSLDSVNAGTFIGTPAQVVQKLIAVLPTYTTGEQYSVSVFKPGFKDGHEITPYAVEDQGGGRYGVLVYDNNYPSEAHVLTVDTNANTWSYQASTNPMEPPDVYQGDATTRTLRLDPVTPGLGVQPCPFCATAGGGARDGVAARSTEGKLEIQLTGNPVHHAHLLITDARGGAIGYRGGTLVEKMPGGTAVFPRVAPADLKETPEPRYLLDPGRAYVITLDNAFTRVRDTEGIEITGPGFSATADALDLVPREKITLGLLWSAGGTWVRLLANHSLQTPILSLGQEQAGHDHSLAVRRDSGLGSGQALTMRFDTRANQLAIQGTPGDYDVAMRYVGPNGAATWGRRDIKVNPTADEKASLSFAHFDPATPATDGIVLQDASTTGSELSSQVPPDASFDIVEEDFSEGQSYSPPPPEPQADQSDPSGDGGTANSIPADSGGDGVPTDSGAGGTPADTGTSGAPTDSGSTG